MRRTGLVLALFAALAGRAAAEGNAGRGRLPSTNKRVYGADFLKPVAGGIAAVGGPTLRWLPPGGKAWREILTVKGHLSRIGWDDAGARVLAVWEEEKTAMHLLGLKDRSHAVIPLPPMGATAQAEFYYVDSISFVPGRNEAVVAMAGPDRRGSAYRVSKAYLVPLDGQAGPAAPTLLWDVHNSGEPVWTSAAGALYILPPTPDYKYHWAASLNAHLSAYLLHDGAVTEQVVSNDAWSKFRGIQAARGSTPERWLGLVTTGRGGFGLLRYRWGEPACTYQDFPPGPGPSGGLILDPHGEELMYVVDRGRELELVRRALPPAADQRSVTLWSPEVNPEVRAGSRTLASHIFGMGFRANGDQWMHLEDDLALVGRDGTIRRVDLRKLVGGRPEWAGSSLAQDTPEGLWIGIEVGSSRDYVWFGFADMERRATPWPPRSAMPPAPALLYHQQDRMTKCLPPGTLIATPDGDIRVEALKVGMPVWTRDGAGARIAGKVLNVVSRPTAPGHRLVRIRLADGRTVAASPGHPLATGAGIETVRVGDACDGSRVESVRDEAWSGSATLDILPAGASGVYWADAIPMGSTLSRWPADRVRAHGAATRPKEARMDSRVVQVLIEDMTTPNAIRPHGIEGADWAKGPRIGMGDHWPEGWTSALMWGQVYLASGGSPAANVRVAIRECAYWILGRRTGRWTRVQSTVEPEGAAYREDFANDANTRADARTEPDGSVSIRLLPGYNFHFWPKEARVTVDPTDVAGQASLFFARLVVDDPAKPDDRGRARLIASCGGDHWRAPDSQWKADWSNNGDWAIGRFKLLTPAWQVFTACSLPPDAVRRNPPPIPLAPTFARPKPAR